MQRTALTDAGRRRALELVRAHRLWETYLAGEDIADPYLHNAAEQLEHAHAVAEELARSLANPKLNPHGEPIPERQVEQEPGRL
jgi:Mn-dependent DtxR family transcriptional regulator